MEDPKSSIDDWKDVFNFSGRVFIALGIALATLSAASASVPDDTTVRAQIVGRPTAVVVQPQAISLSGPRAFQQIIVTGIYADGTMFALVHDGVIYLKSGGPNAAAFEREGLAPFSYPTKDGKRAVMSYRRMPDRLYDDPDELAQWARAALSAARQGTPSKKSSPGRAGKTGKRRR